MSYWISANELPARSAYYVFQKQFTAQSSATLTARICADTRYILYLNGNEVCEGPCQGPSALRFFESADLTPYLKEGDNLISVRVLFADEETFISQFRGNRPSLWFDGTLCCCDKTVPLRSDASWSCYRDDTVRPYRQGFHSLPPFEEVYAEECFTKTEVIECYEPTPERGGFTPWGIADSHILQKRPIPQMQTHAPRAFTVVRKGETYIDLDAGVYTTAKLSLCFRAKKGETVRAIYAECYAYPPTEESGVKKEIRDDFKDPKKEIFGVCDTLHVSGKEQCFSPFWYRAFRYIRLEFAKGADFELLDASYSPYFYPLGEEGKFLCSDERLIQMWNVSRNTVLCCMHETFVDCPYYEQQQYEMDSALEMLFSLRLSGDTRLAKKALTDLAHSQLPDGMLQANYPSTGIQVIPDFTFFWILMLRDYLLYTGDTETVSKLLGTADKALEAFEPLKNGDGMIMPRHPYWNFVDWVPSWDRGVPGGGDEEPMTVTCLMYAAALRALSEICRACKRSMRAEEYRFRAEQMCDTVTKQCFDSAAGLYRNTPTRREFSQHTTLWAVLSGAVQGEDAKKLIDNTFSGDEHVESCTFSMNYYLLRALEATDRYDTYAPRIFEGWQRMLDLHCTTWCENPDDPRSECHGWSSAPIYEFSAMLLGVSPLENGFRTLQIKPHTSLFGLSYAEGSIPTPYGSVKVRWEQANGNTELSVTLPHKDMCAYVVLPDGTQRQTKENETYLFH